MMVRFQRGGELMGICPHCGENLTSVETEPIMLLFGLKEFRGVSFSCANCHAVLSVGPDPVAVRSDLVQALVEALRQG
jgi:hypothetical protein